MRRLWNKIIIWLFWTDVFKEVRGQCYRMAYEQGKFDQEIELNNFKTDYNYNFNNFIQMEDCLNEKNQDWF